MATDKTIRRITNFKAQREETYQYWRSRPFVERIEAVTEVVRMAYSAKGIDIDSLPSSKTLRRIEYPDWKSMV